MGAVCAQNFYFFFNAAVQGSHNFLGAAKANPGRASAAIAMWATLGFAYCMTVRETDVYYNGVNRDFMKTDEALRVRTCSRWQEGNPKDSESTLTNAPENSSQDISRESFITYKGPKLDDSSSTRIEHEIMVNDPDEARQLLSSLGYIPVFTVDKTRREFNLPAESGRPFPITLCVDCVTGLSAHMELETLAPSEDAKDDALRHLFSILDAMNIPRENLTRKSYLELLIAAQTAGK